MTLSADASKKPSANDIEVKDAQLIFDPVWKSLEAEVGRENLRFPKEIILLGGAPGAGKGTNTNFILKARGLTCEPVVVSSLLNSPEAKAIKDAGGMVGDREVINLIVRALLDPQYRDGVILDGFPRTRVQVECLKMLVEKIQALHKEFHDTVLAMEFRHCTIHVMVLFVDENTAIERQLKRGREVKEHNDEVRRTGEGGLLEERPTDYDSELARRRYRVFKEQTWDALQSLSKIFHYHSVNAMGSLSEVERDILDELQYQSSLELDPQTFDMVRGLPLASEIVVHARQELVRRIDSYALEHREQFQDVIRFIERRMMPIILRHAISGVAVVNTEDAMLGDPLALAMLIDVFSERGYHATVDIHRIEVPESFDVKTGMIICREKRVYRVQVRFAGSEIRRGS